MNTHTRILAIYPDTSAFGFAVIETRGFLVDWGLATLHSVSDEEFMVRVEALFEKYRPAIVAVEDRATSKRRDRAKRRIALVADYAAERGAIIARATKADVRNALKLPSDATAHGTAVRLADAFEELRVHLPRERRLWEGRDQRMAMFAAVALAATAVRSLAR